MPWKDATIIVPESGTASSPRLPAVYLHNFSMLCDAGASWKYKIDDGDGYPITSSGEQGQDGLEGPAAVPVGRKCRDLTFTLLEATPGTYHFRAYVD